MRSRTPVEGTVHIPRHAQRTHNRRHFALEYRARTTPVVRAHTGPLARVYFAQASALMRAFALSALTDRGLAFPQRPTTLR